MLVVFGAFLKSLLAPAYASTDFDVHRNWLAVTYNLPLADWYFEDTSVWTLDYPPFFAYFEYLLTFLCPQWAINDGCLAIRAADGEYGWPTLMFQRATVIASELLLAYALKQVNQPPVFALLWLCPAWLVLDHIHFQYNGFLFGLFILSLLAIKRSQHVQGAFVFAVLLCFKHIYLYVAPAYFVYLLRFYLLDSPSLIKFVKLGLATVLPFGAAIAPLVLASANKTALFEQLGARLFPFSRGLTHAYWAPNFWALYSFTDRFMGILNHNSIASATRGIVGQVSFANLPEVLPRVTFIITATIQVLTALRMRRETFVEGVALSGLAAFLFGWHVHEKAVLVPLVPLALVALNSAAHLRAFYPLLASGCISLLPLLWTPAETVLKYVYTGAYLVIAGVMLTRYTKNGSLGIINVLYALGFLVVLPSSALMPILLPKYEYAGLMLISVYSALGVFMSFLRLLLI